MARILITGCSSGFGLLSAVELAGRGHHVYATMRDPARAGALHDAASTAGAEVEVVALDVNDQDSVDAAIDRVRGAGGLDALVNNAGIEVRGPVEHVDDAALRAQFETNVFGLARMVRAATPLLRASDGGVVVNVSSIAGIIARPFAGVYAASKHAVEALTEALHFELGLHGIRVHAIEPGQFPTALGSNAVDIDTPDDRYREVGEALDSKVRSLVPERDDGAGADPGDVARAIADAVEDPATPLRVPVGGDAALILAARGGNSFEDYEMLMRSTLDYWEGFRGERPS